MKPTAFPRHHAEGVLLRHKQASEISRCKEGFQNESEATSADSSDENRCLPLSQYAEHPFVVRNPTNHRRYCLSDEFYNEALRLHQLGCSITQILEVYEIDVSAIPADTLRRIRQKLASWKNTTISSTLTAEQHCRYARNRTKLLEEAVASQFAGIKAKVPSMSRAELKEFCRWVDALPADTAQGYGKRN